MSTKVAGKESFFASKMTNDYEVSSSTHNPESVTASIDTEAEHISHTLTPFQLVWSFGINKDIPVLNLTDSSKSIIFYASCHTGVLYDYKTKEMKLLQGHKNPVSTIAADESGKWIVTADAGEDNALVVWDSETCLPIFTLFNPYEYGGTDVARISKDAKYLLTVSNCLPQPMCCMWLWTLGKDTPDDTIVLDESLGEIKAVEFHPAIHEYIMLTSRGNVVFLTWESGKLSSHIPQIKLSKPIGVFTESVYLPHSYRAMSATSNGSVVVWGIFKHTVPYDLKSDTNIKNQINFVHLQKEAINVIRASEKVVVTGNTSGHIRFYDHTLRLLYWCQSFKLDPITSINFHRKCEKSTERFSGEETHGSNTIKNSSEEEEMEVLCIEEDNMEENEMMYNNMIPTDASIKSLPFIVPDFITFTSNGQVGIVDFLKNSYQSILYKSEANLSALDVHPEMPHICVGNTAGRLALYNYNTMDGVHSNNISDGSDAIRSLKYASNGFYIACGMNNGSLWILHPQLLTSLSAEPFRNTKSAISKISVSADSVYLAHIDDSFAVSVYFCRNMSTNTWVYLGKNRTHYKPIKDVLFYNRDDGTLCLLSLGEDRVIVEYDLQNSEPGNLKVVQKVRIEQSAVPLCMALYPNFTENKKEKLILVSNSQYKYKLLGIESKECVKTALGPTCESPISLMKVLSQTTAEKEEQGKQYIVYATKTNIGIQTLPVDGNPFKYVSVVGHPPKVLDLCVTFDNKHMFTISSDDSSVLMWNINIRAAQVMEHIGGTGLEPYYSLLEGGQSGWLFSEMKEFFYYVQIFHQSNKNEYKISNKIPVCSVPDIFRACGYYPSEYEVDLVMNEIEHTNRNKAGMMEFEDFVHLYINHRPAFGISTDILKNYFRKYCDEHPDTNAEPIISRETILKFLQDEGEAIFEEDAVKFLTILIPESEMKAKGYIPQDAEPNTTNIIPEKISFEMLSSDILGILHSIPGSDMTSVADIKDNANDDVC